MERWRRTPVLMAFALLLACASAGGQEQNGTGKEKTGSGAQEKENGAAKKKEKPLLRAAADGVVDAITDGADGVGKAAGLAFKGIIGTFRRSGQKLRQMLFGDDKEKEKKPAEEADPKGK